MTAVEDGGWLTLMPLTEMTWRKSYDKKNQQTTNQSNARAHETHAKFQPQPWAGSRPRTRVRGNRQLTALPITADAPRRACLSGLSRPRRRYPVLLLLLLRSCAAAVARRRSPEATNQQPRVAAATSLRRQPQQHWIRRDLPPARACGGRVGCRSED
jgi:hypothetical protein